MEQNEEPFEEIRFEQYLEWKEIYDGHNLLNFLGQAKNINIKGGYHIIKINSHVENLDIEGADVEAILQEAMRKIDECF